MITNCFGDVLRQAFCVSVVTAHYALKFGKLAHHARNEVGFSQSSGLFCVIRISASDYARLDQRSRRWITMVGVSESSSSIPIRSHTYAAMASGNASLEEMHEFVLQYALHGGWPKASVMQSAVFEMGKRVAEGLPFEA